MLSVYGYQKCSTCRDAVKWLEARKIPFEWRPIRETPPTRDELETALNAFGGDLRKLFNTSGMDYRALGLKDQMPTLDPDAAFSLLEGNGNLVKRPFVIGDGTVLVGFKPDVWQQALG